MSGWTNIALSTNPAQEARQLAAMLKTIARGPFWATRYRLASSGFRGAVFINTDGTVGGGRVGQGVIAGTASEAIFNAGPRIMTTASPMAPKMGKPAMVLGLAAAAFFLLGGKR